MGMQHRGSLFVLPRELSPPPMKLLRTLSRLCTLGFVAALTAAVASAFEGKVVMSMTAGKDSSTMTYYVKGTKQRIEFTMPGEKSRTGTMAMIVDWDKKEWLMLMAEQKTYLVQPMPDMSSMADQKGTDFKPTGRKEKIAGYDAEEYVGTSNGKRIEVWTTKALGNFMMANQGKGGPFGKGKQSGAWEKFMRDNEFFALRMVQRAKEGAKEELRMEVTNVDKTQQADALFKAPADFQRMEIPNMGGLLKGMIPGNNQNQNQNR